jgi:hypothetical protein
LYRWIASTSALLALGAPLFLVACGDDDADVCAAGDDVRESVQTILDMNVIEEGTNALEEAFDEFQADVEALGDEAAEEFDDEIAAVRTAADSVSSAITETEGDPLPDRADVIGEAVTALGDATTALLSAVDTVCEE